MRAFAAWFTPERRQKIQAALITLAPLAIFFGYGTTGQWEQILVISGAFIGALAGLLNLVNVRIQDWSTQGWAIVRGVVYGFATTVSPALVLLGFYNDEINTQIVTGTAIALTALNSAIGIFANGQQQKEVVLQQVRDERVRHYDN